MSQGRKLFFKIFGKKVFESYLEYLISVLPNNDLILQTALTNDLILQTALTQSYLKKIHIKSLIINKAIHKAMKYKYEDYKQ